MSSALILFVKNMQRGKVKTRIAATAGDDKALEIYTQLVQHTYTVAQGADADKYIFYSDYRAINDSGCPVNFQKKVQQGNDLGERMMQAFQQLFQKDYHRIVIIGSDCMEITTTLIQQAFEQLLTTDVVIGPAKDGGYYLLGLNKMHPALFGKIDWSTDKVLRQTIEACHHNGLQYELLTALNDIDEEQDWQRMIKNKSAE